MKTTNEKTEWVMEVYRNGGWCKHYFTTQEDALSLIKHASDRGMSLKFSTPYKRTYTPLPLTVLYG